MYGSSSRDTFECCAKDCNYSGRSDKLRRHYRNLVKFNNDGNPVNSTNTVIWSKLTTEEQNHVKVFSDRGLTLQMRQNG